MHTRTVFVVDDDASVRDSLSLLLSLRGYATAMFATAEDFLDALKPHWRGVVLTDIRMPGMSGLDLQGKLAQHPARLPVVIVTGHGDIAAARQALKARAIDFLEKPFDSDRLVRAIDDALGTLPPERSASAAKQALSTREKEVLAFVVDGVDNRTMGERLAISPRTVEVHKARIMAKLGASNLIELIRIARGLG